MGEFIYIIWFLFIFAEIFILSITFYYLKREYKHATRRYYSKVKNTNIKMINNEELNAIKRFSVIKKDNLQDNIIKMNITQYIDTKQINQQVGYAKLTFDKKGNIIKKEKIYQDETQIGRDSHNDIIVNDNTVSREQCLIIRTDNKFTLCNLSKRNNTRLNGQIVKDTKEIRYGDVVKIGDISFKFDDILEVI